MQRKQTLWLLLAAISLVLSFFIPFGLHSGADMAGVVTDSPLNSSKNTLLMLLVAGTAGLSLVTIFLHHNRSMQMRLSLLVLLLSLLCFVDMLYLCNSIQGNKHAIGLVGSTLYLGSLLPLVGAALAVLAFIGIRKDDQLIKSVDRLR